MRGKSEASVRWSAATGGTILTADKATAQHLRRLGKQLGVKPHVKLVSNRIAGHTGKVIGLDEVSALRMEHGKHE